MDQVQVITFVSSVVFVPTAVATLRKLYPAINGNWVHLLSLVISLACMALVVFAPKIPPYIWPFIGTLAVSVGTAGGTTYIDRLIKRNNPPPEDSEATKARNEEVVP